MHKTGYVSFGWQTTESEFGPHSRVKEEAASSQTPVPSNGCALETSYM